jgi:hypothetical protein
MVKEGPAFPALIYFQAPLNMRRCDAVAGELCFEQLAAKKEHTLAFYRRQP